ncbi:Probable serine/threonine protein kinase IREH1 [Linum grandiflorum]
MSGSDERDDVYDDIVESDIELDNADVLEADKDPQQKMGNFTSPVTDESLDAAQEEKSKAMDAHSEGRLTEAVDHLTEAVLLNPVSAILYASRGSVYVKMKELNAATPIRDANAALEVRFYYSFTCSENLYLVKEYLNGGCLDEDVARVYIAEVVLALEYLHSLRVVHRDLKPDNLLIAHDCHIKLTDFGLSKVGLINRTDDLSGPAAGRTSMLVDDEPELSTLDQQERMKKRSAVCTPDYLAPEILLGTGRGFTADWWSVGIILFELIVGIPPFNAEHPQIIFDNILNRKIPWPEVPDEMSPEARDIIFGLLTEDPHMRLGARGASEVKQHVFFKNINWDTLARKKAVFVPASDNTLDTSCFMSRYTWNTSADNACPGSDFEDSSDADSLSGSSRCLSNRQEDVLHLQSSEENGDISMKQLNIRWTTKGHH